MIIRRTNSTLEKVQSHCVQATLVCYVMFYDKMLIWWTSALFALAGRPALPGYALPTQCVFFEIWLRFWKSSMMQKFKTFLILQQLQTSFIDIQNSDYCERKGKEFIWHSNSESFFEKNWQFDCLWWSGVIWSTM